ncbi:PAS domain-containing sensor histidine kinase [Methanogenium cariaci]
MGKHMLDYQASFQNDAVPMNIINDDGRLCSVNRASTGYFRGASSVLENQSPISFSGAVQGVHAAVATDAVPVGHVAESIRLHRALEYIRVAEEGVGIGFWDSLVKERALSVDSGWAHIIGYEAGELGTSFDEIFMNRIHPVDRTGVAAYLARIDSGTTSSARTEFRMRHRDGRWIWVRSVCRVAVYDAAGSPERVAGLHMDVTPEHEMLDALAEAKKKIVLLSSVTRHDILNQVSVILMCDELVRGDTGLAPLTQEQADHYWDMANAAARTVGRLISFTSDYDALGMEPPRWQNLATVVRNVETLLHGAGVSVNLACGEIEVFADPMFEKVAYNLLENVQRHAGGANRVTIALAETEEGCVLTISDDGSGVPRELKERIFERGYGTNTGLGLFLSREMLGITGISITECGTCGTGAVFRLVIPRHHIRRGGSPV